MICFLKNLYRKHLKLAAQGKFKFYSKTLPSHTDILVMIDHMHWFLDTVYYTENLSL